MTKTIIVLKDYFGWETPLIEFKGTGGPKTLAAARQLAEEIGGRLYVSSTQPDMKGIVICCDDDNLVEATFMADFLR